MDLKIQNKITTKAKVLLLVIIFILLGALRFVNLGYSEYSPDETTVMQSIKDRGGYTLNSLISQRKGPVQFMAAQLVHSLGFDVHNELSYRAPFALASVMALFFMFLTVLNITGLFTVAILSVVIFGLNGFTVAFGRIVQYQNFNLLFSFFSTYLYSLVLVKGWSEKKSSRIICLSLVIYLLSFASHWDAVFVLPLFIYMFLRVRQMDISKHFRLSTFYTCNILPVVMLIIPFVMLFVYLYAVNQAHADYFTSRVSVVSPSFNAIKERFNGYVFRSRVYFPFVYLEFISATLVLSLLSFRRIKSILIWALTLTAFFIVFISKPGTHIYNIYIPLSVLSAYGIYSAGKYFKGYFVVLPVLAVLPFFVFIYYQNYLIYIDSKVEYPWERETIYKWKTEKYTQQSLSNNLLGFPIRRNWEEINSIIKRDMSGREGSFTFVTNEVRSISSFYIDIPHGYSSRMYGVGIKMPFSFANDYSFPQYHNRDTIEKIYYKGKNVARLYLIIDNKEANEAD